MGDWFEMHMDVECPHCGNETQEHAEFNMSEAEDHGVESGYYEVECHECYKKFWFNGRVSFETEVRNILTKKPKGFK